MFEEIKHIENEQQTVVKFSVVGYSLGGLVARYLVGILHQRKFFEKVAPMNFCTVATPHIGLIKYPSTRWKLFSYLGPRLLSRTGEQFFAVDKWSTSGRPLVEVLADPGKYRYCFGVFRLSHCPAEQIFYQALSVFSRLCFYANAINDTTVPYLCAAPATEDPFIDYAAKGLEM